MDTRRDCVLAIWKMKYVKLYELHISNFDFRSRGTKEWNLISLFNSTNQKKILKFQNFKKLWSPPKTPNWRPSSNIRTEKSKIAQNQRAPPFYAFQIFFMTQSEYSETENGTRRKGGQKSHPLKHTLQHTKSN